MPEGPRRSPLLATLSAFALTGLSHSLLPDLPVKERAEKIANVIDGSMDEGRQVRPKRAPLRVQTHGVDEGSLWEAGELNWEAAEFLKDCSEDCDLQDQLVPGYEDLVVVDCGDTWAYVGPIYDDPSHWILLDSSSIDLSDYLHFGFDVWNYAAEWDDEMDFDENLEEACDLIHEEGFEEPEMCEQLDEYLDELEAADLLIHRKYIEDKCGDTGLVEFSAGVFSFNQTLGLECGLSLTEQGNPVSFWCSRGWHVPYSERGDFFVVGGGQYDYLPSAQQIKAAINMQTSFSLPSYSLGLSVDWDPPIVDAKYAFEPVDTAESAEEDSGQDTGFHFDEDLDSGDY